MWVTALVVVSTRSTPPSTLVQNALSPNAARSGPPPVHPAAVSFDRGGIYGFFLVLAFLVWGLGWLLMRAGSRRRQVS